MPIEMYALFMVPENFQWSQSLIDSFLGILKIALYKLRIFFFIQSLNVYFWKSFSPRNSVNYEWGWINFKSVTISAENSLVQIEFPQPLDLHDYKSIFLHVSWVRKKNKLKKNKFYSKFFPPSLPRFWSPSPHPPSTMFSPTTRATRAHAPSPLAPHRRCRRQRPPSLESSPPITRESRGRNNSALVARPVEVRPRHVVFTVGYS